MRRLALCLLLATALAVGCHGTNYKVHPGSLSRSDSVFYDALLTAEGSINAAKASTLSPERKAALNQTIRVYNVARTAWLTYRRTPNGNPAEVNAALVQLSNALLALRNAK
jgi:hypothetical protein